MLMWFGSRVSIRGSPECRVTWGERGNSRWAPRKRGFGARTAWLRAPKGIWDMASVGVRRCSPARTSAQRSRTIAQDRGSRSSEAPPFSSWTWPNRCELRSATNSGYQKADRRVRTASRRLRSGGQSVLAWTYELDLIVTGPINGCWAPGCTGEAAAGTRTDLSALQLDGRCRAANSRRACGARL